MLTRKEARQLAIESSTWDNMMVAILRPFIFDVISAHNHLERDGSVRAVELEWILLLSLASKPEYEIFKTDQIIKVKERLGHKIQPHDQLDLSDWG